NDQALALREALIAAGSPVATSSSESEKPISAPVDPQQAMTALRLADEKFPTIVQTMKEKIDNLFSSSPPLTNPRAQQAFEQWQLKTRKSLAQLLDVSQRLREWNPNEPVPAYRAITSFLFGTDWITASFWQDWYGIIPLLVGSILVAADAVLIRVP